MLHAAVAAPVPAWWMTLSLAFTCLLLVLLLLPGRWLLQHRSVLAHVPLARAWESVGDLPALLGRHGRAEAARRIETWSLLRGAGRTSGTIWRAEGRWDHARYSADLEILACDDARLLEFRLRRDTLGTHRGLREHRNSLRLEALGPERTKISWTLRARLRPGRLLAARLVSRPRLEARLFDISLRSLKMMLEQETRETARSGSPAAPRPTPDPPLEPFPRTSIAPGAGPRSTLG